MPLVLVVEDDDSTRQRVPADIPARDKIFGANRWIRNGMLREIDNLYWNWNGADINLPLDKLQLSGEHNIENAMAALSPSFAADWQFVFTSSKSITLAMSSYSPVTPDISPK